MQDRRSVQWADLTTDQYPNRWRVCAQVVQEIKVLRSSVSQREKEKAERATLVVQERLVKAKARALDTLEASRVSGSAPRVRRHGSQ